MFKLFFILTLFCLSCCSEKKTKNSIEIKDFNSSGLTQELYSQLFEYQRKFPLPKSLKSGLYVYEAIFSKQSKDTVLLLRRSSEGFNVDKNEMVLGVYSDARLLPTVIIDSKSFYSKDFIIKMINDSIKLKEYKTQPNTTYPESFPPVYEYKIHQKSMILEKIDTVWQIWR